MPRPHLASSVAQAAERLIGSITALVQNLHAAVTSAPAGKVSAAPTSQRGPGKGNPRLKSALKKSWASYTPAQRAERVRKMLAGRGLKPKGAGPKKDKAASAPKVKRVTKAKPGGVWAAMTPEQRAERIARMRAGRTKG